LPLIFNSGMGRNSIKELRKQEIIEVFYGVAASEGLENTSIAKIAAEMECNPSLIIHYFKTKEDLIYGLIDFILERYYRIFKVDAADITSKKDLMDILERLFSRTWNDLIDDGVFYSCYALTFKNDRIKKKFKLLHQKLRKKLTEILKHCRENGLIKTRKLQQKTEIFFVILEGAYYYSSLIRNEQEYQEQMEVYKKTAFSVLDL
jgi:AcrR family transcriptional regulator